MRTNAKKVNSMACFYGHLFRFGLCVFFLFGLVAIGNPNLTTLIEKHIHTHNTHSIGKAINNVIQLVSDQSNQERKKRKNKKKNIEEILLFLFKNPKDIKEKKRNPP